VESPPLIFPIPLRRQLLVIFVPRWAAGVRIAAFKRCCRAWALFGMGGGFVGMAFTGTATFLFISRGSS
jgi:hypothetical protein